MEIINTQLSSEGRNHRGTEKTWQGRSTFGGESAGSLQVGGKLRASSIVIGRFLAVTYMQACLCSAQRKLCTLVKGTKSHGEENRNTYSSQLYNQTIIHRSDKSFGTNFSLSNYKSQIIRLGVLLLFVASTTRYRVKNTLAENRYSVSRLIFLFIFVASSFFSLGQQYYYDLDWEDDCNGYYSYLPSCYESTGYRITKLNTTTDADGSAFFVIPDDMPDGCHIEVRLESSNLSRGTRNNSTYDYIRVYEATHDGNGNFTRGTRIDHTNNNSNNDRGWAPYRQNNQNRQPTTPDAVTTSAGVRAVWIEFTNGRTENNSAFEIWVYCTGCEPPHTPGNDINMNQQEQTIPIECGTYYWFYDSGGATGQYGNNQNFTYTFTSTGQIYIQFYAFNTEEGYDSITIKDATTNTTLADRQSGNGTLNGRSFRTSGVGHNMRVTWHSDFNGLRDGWRAIIWAEDCPATSCTTTPAFTNCPSSLMSGQTWNPIYWNTTATPTGWTTSNATYSGGTVTAGATIGSASVSATVAESLPYCAGTMTCNFNVTCNNTNTLTVTSPIEVTVGGSSVDIDDYITANSSGGTPTFSTSSGNITLNTTTGVVTGVTAGDATVRVTVPQKTTGGITYCEKYVDVTIHVVEPGNDCEISYNLIDSWGDGWNGNAINVVDLTTGTDLATWTIGSGSSASGTLTVTDGHVLQFSWVSGSYSSECSYEVVAADGTRILEGSNAMNPTTQTYTVSCPTCLRPSDLTGSISGNTATISWTENSGATSWIVEYSTNSDFTNATSVNVNTNPATITIPGIVSATPYYFQVKSNCGGEQSSWSEEIYLCVPPSNISCATATTLSCGASLNGTTFCTPGTAHGIPGVTISNYGVWYTFVGDGNLTTISSTAASGFYHEMDIMSGSCGNYTLITAQDLSYNGGTETFTFLTENGVNYYVYIASTYTDATTGTFTISRTCEEYVCNSSNTITLNSTQTVNIGCGTSYCFFDSGGLDGTYSGNEDYTLTLTSTGVIHIKFKTDLIGESGWDTMSIRGTTTEVIRSSSIPAGTEYVASTQGGTVIIHWKSDNSDHYAGWYAIITAEDCCTERDGHLNITSDPACPASIPYGSTLQLIGSVESNYGAGTASWSTSNADVATVSDGGIVSTSGIGSAVITYTRAYDGTYCHATTTCTVNITVPTPTITQTDDPLPQCDIEDAILVASVPTGTAVPPGYTYHWYTNSTCAAETEITSGVSGTNNNTLRYPAASATQVWCRLEKRSTTTTFNYTGNVQTFTVPTGTIMLTMEAWGAQGGNADTRFSGGLGGYSVGTLSSPTGTLYVCVGGVGTTDDGSYSSYTSMPGGYNGGGAGRAWGNTSHGGGGGGGATHIATATGTLASLSANTNSVLIVAGGGGGASDNGNGGSGGGTSGGSGNGDNGCAPGTQTTGSAWGYATDCTYTNGECGGGGGGWYGGYSATGENYAGGGGSGYLKSTLTSASTTAGQREGNGQAKITAILPNGNTIDSTSLAGNITILCCDIDATIDISNP